MKRWLLNLLIWLDIGLNVVVFAGSPYETISSRVGKRRDNGDCWACIFCWLLNRLDPRHCDKSLVPDIGENAPNWWKGLAIWVVVFLGFAYLWRLPE